MAALTVPAGAGIASWGDRSWPCAIGRNGACAADGKREGDGRTPIGRWPIRAALLRRDRGVTPPERLPWRWLRPDDGWCDAPDDPAYNRPVRHPYLASAERLWRDDALYDTIVLIGHNDRPAVAGAGSAIFLHLRVGDATAGCVAVPRDAMAVLLATMSRDDAVVVTA